MGTLVFQATLGGQVNLTGPNTASTFTISVPAVTGTMAALASVTNNGVTYVNSSGQPTSGSALTFDGTNLGLGVTPSAWGGGYKAFEVNAGSVSATTGAGNLIVSNNSYYNGTNYIYKATGVATDYVQTGGQHWWRNASSGTAGNAITFTQAMTLDASGNLLVGTTSQVGTSKISAYKNATGYMLGLNAGQASSGVTYYQVEFYSAGNACGTITSTTTTTSYNITSDQRLKENIQDADDASALVDSLQVRKFDWKINGEHQRYGFVAQELVTVAPEAVHHPENDDEMMAVDYSKLVPMLVKEIQSLRKRLATAGI